MKRSLFVLVAIVMAAQLAIAQEPPPQSPGWFNRYGRWTIGVEAGANMWVNDFDTRDFTLGGNAILRYAATRHISVGLMAGYDELKSENVNIVPTDAALKHSLIKATGFSGDLVAWIHGNAGKTFSPYMYLGIGQMFYQRKVEGDAPWPADKSYNSIHVPFGFGCEVAVSREIALNLDLGGKVMNKVTDNYTAGKENFLGTDWYPTGRLGVNVYLGTSDDDDDDGDMLTNGYEKTIGTDPLKADTDNDGLTDYEELAKYRTSALSNDTDGDGLTDGEEVITRHTDPLKADTDGDGLKDGDEVARYRTDPLKADTDADGLTDGDEVFSRHTDPLKSDTDGDGLSDYDELTKYRTDPLKIDTDGGTVSDAQELANKTNPLDPLDDVPKKVMPVEVGKAIVLEGIVFRSGKATIDPASETVLNEALASLRENPNVAVEIRGYTDNVGKVAANKKLSLNRAEAVKAWLVAKGIDPTRLVAKGYGPENPIADNATPEGRAQNRRIEFFRTK